MTTVSFDFDNTLWDEELQCLFPECLRVLRGHLAKGDRVIIVTSRVLKWIPECQETLQKVGLTLEIFSAPGSGLEDDPDDYKSLVLIREKASIHFDDLHESTEFNKARSYGIQVLPPPVEIIVSTGMY